jgi:hypothetical protein
MLGRLVTVMVVLACVLWGGVMAGRTRAAAGATATAALDVVPAQAGTDAVPYAARGGRVGAGAAAAVIAAPKSTQATPVPARFAATRPCPVPRPRWIDGALARPYTARSVDDGAVHRFPDVEAQPLGRPERRRRSALPEQAAVPPRRHDNAARYADDG